MSILNGMQLDNYESFTELMLNQVLFSVVNGG